MFMPYSWKMALMLATTAWLLVSMALLLFGIEKGFLVSYFGGAATYAMLCLYEDAP